MSDVVQFPKRRGGESPEDWAEMWDGLLSVMQANGRRKVEIGISEVRRIADEARSRCKP